MLDTLAALIFLFMAGKQDAKAVMRAHRDFKRMRGTGNSFSTKYPKSPSIKMFEGARVSILFQYYLCGRKKFFRLKSVS